MFSMVLDRDAGCNVHYYSVYALGLSRPGTRFCGAMECEAKGIECYGRAVSAKYFAEPQVIAGVTSQLLPNQRMGKLIEVSNTVLWWKNRKLFTW
jgi:hypothetical protein